MFNRIALGNMTSLYQSGLEKWLQVLWVPDFSHTNVLSYFQSLPKPTLNTLAKRSYPGEVKCA